jgi:hypothetical protein
MHVLVKHEVAVTLQSSTKQKFEKWQYHLTMCLDYYSLHVGEEVVDPSIVEDQTNGGGGGSDAENRGENDDPPMPKSVTSPTALPFDLHAYTK